MFFGIIFYCGMNKYMTVFINSKNRRNYLYGFNNLYQLILLKLACLSFFDNITSILLYPNCLQLNIYTNI